MVTTDPGSKMEQIAREENFREIFPGIPSCRRTLFRPVEFRARSCRAHRRRSRHAARSRARDGPALRVRRTRTTPPSSSASCSAKRRSQGCDKPTLIAPPGIASFGGWLEQLVAESLGKQGKGIIPIDGETPGQPEVYGRDRLFVHLRSAAAPDAAADALVEQARARGSSGCAHRVARSLCSGRRVLSLGVCDRRGGRRAGSQSVRSARRRGGKGRDTPAGRGVRADQARCRTKPPASPENGSSRRSSATTARGRLLRPAGIYRDEPGPPQRARRHSRPRPRSAEGRDDRRLRSAISSFDRPGAQGRTELGCVSDDHLRRPAGPARARAALHASARSSGCRHAAISKCSPRAAAACCACT